MVKMTQVHFNKMVKNGLASPKNNHIAKNEMGMGKYSLRYHTHNFKTLHKKNDKKDTAEL